MTAALPVDRAAASRLIAALEHAWTAIHSRHPEVPEVVIVVASGSDPRSRRLNLGHFAAGRWQLTSPDQTTGLGTDQGVVVAATTHGALWAFHSLTRTSLLCKGPAGRDLPCSAPSR
jgi:hypothetical protein